MEVEIIRQTPTTHRNFPDPAAGSQGSDSPRHRITVDHPEFDTSFSDKDLKALVENFRKEEPSFSRRFELRVNKEINRIVIKVVDLSTDKVIKEIPPDEVQRMLAGIRRALGLVIDKKI